MDMDEDDSDCNSLDATKEGDNDDTHVVEAEGSVVEDDVVVDKEELCTPTFNAKGKFIRYEKREAEEDNPAIMQPLDEAVSTQSHNTYCNWKYGIWISLLLITFAVVVAIVFYTGEKIGESKGQSEESMLQSSNKHTHTHPKKEHSCRNCPPTLSPVVSSVSDPVINRPFKPGKTKPGSAISVSTETGITPWSEGGDIRIGASSVSTVIIIRSNPDYRWGGVKELSVESDEQISYIRFDLSPINRFMSGGIDLDISKVILWLYMTTHQDDEDSIKVDMLPAAGRWKDSSVSWNNPPDAKDAFYVDSFVTKGVEVGLVLIQVDVTPAFINSSYDTAVTFKLYAESTSNGVYSFASREWEEGESIPELVVTVSA